MERMMRDYEKKKTFTLSIAPEHISGPSTFAVWSPPHPPKFIKYGPDDHTPVEDLTAEFKELLMRIALMNMNSKQDNPMVRSATMFHASACTLKGEDH